MEHEETMSTYASVQENIASGSWSDGNDFCYNNYGSYLATIENKGDALRAINEIVPAQGMWIGLNDLENEGFWQFYDGTTCGDDEGVSCDATGSPYWLEGQPNNILLNQHCVWMRLDGSWDDVTCKREENFICQKFALSS